MLRSPTVRDDGTGSAVLVKHATGSDCSRLRHEADLLGSVRSEGVVAAIGFEESENRCELRLHYLEAATLAEHPPLGLADVLDVLMALGTSLAELHQQGVRHGALSRDHVLLARPLQPVLCGFGHATGPMDSQQNPPGADLEGLAAIAETELTRTDRIVTTAAERRTCGDALAASRDLAAAASQEPDSKSALHTWIAHLGALRNGAGSEPLDLGLRSQQAEPERTPLRWDRQRMTTTASVVALVIVAIIGWRMLADGTATSQNAGSYGANESALPEVGISTATTAIAALEAGELEPGGELSADTEPSPDASGLTTATPADDGSNPGGATLLYSTAPAESSSPPDGTEGPGTGLLALPSGRWSLLEGDAPQSLHCDVVVVHYGDLSIDTGEAAAPISEADPPESDGGASESSADG